VEKEEECEKIRRDSQVLFRACLES
jgi:hypothetical protein